MKRQHRETKQLAESVGLTVVDMRMSGGSHLRMTVQRDDGERCIFFSPATPSDYRGARNRLAELRHFANGTRNYKKH